MQQDIHIALSSDSVFHKRLSALGYQCSVISSLQDATNLSADIVLLSRDLMNGEDFGRWKAESAAQIILSDQLYHELDLEEFAFYLPEGISDREVNKLLSFARQQFELQTKFQAINTSYQRQTSGLSKLVDIGIALSTEDDLNTLLESILAEGMSIAGCDAASLFLIEKDENGQQQLKFKLTRNESVCPSFEEQCIPLTDTSIVGHTALHGEVLNISDAYEIPNTASYQFNRSFDKVMSYRTVSLLAIPMQDHQHQIVGVLEFINRKKSPDAKLDTPAMIKEQVIDFDGECVGLLRALSSQAAVAIEGRRLMDNIGRLFDGFVNASVFAIEQRDPCTSGHSFRVANLCEALAMNVNKCGQGILNAVTFSDEQYRELRFAALLHDFGKVGVRENVLTKAKKLSPENVEILKYRCAYAKQQLKNQSLQQIINIYEQYGKLEVPLKEKLEAQLNQDLEQLDYYMEVILSANEPSILPQERYSELEQIRSHLVSDYTGKLGGFISEEELAALSIAKGSLSEVEREEIESHVSHTMKFLELIPWTPELSQIPRIAGAHHEKLDGSGYPNHLKSDAIPFQSRIMTICDIYDALTAADRPYKPALPTEKALSILEQEAKLGLIDPNVVKVFIESRSYQQAKDLNGRYSQSSGASGYAHHVCDIDLHKH